MHRHSAVALLVAISSHAAQSRPALRLRPDGTFKIALFCDMHFGEGVVKDAKTVAFEHAMLRMEYPDLAVIDGDASSNYAAPHCSTLNNHCKDWFLNNWRQFTAPFVANGVPYAYTLGNHDRIPGPGPRGAPGDESRYEVADHWIMSQDAENAFSISEDGPTVIHGASNYVVPVLGGDGKPAAYIWLMDSSDTDCLGQEGWGCVYPDQVSWYLETSRRLAEQDGRVVPGIMFHHIPLNEVLHAWNDPDVPVNGTKGELVCCFSVNTGLFAAIKQTGNIWGVFHGHDHNNDFVALYEGVRLGFGRKSGYGGYGGSVADHPGSRIFELRVARDGAVAWDTWVRLETGERLLQSGARHPPAGMREDLCCGASPGPDGGELDATHACRTADHPAACRLAAGVDGWDQPLEV